MLLMALLLFLVWSTHVQEISLTDTSLQGVCTEGYFQCANSTMCIPQEDNCNHIDDCPNGSDETNCDDKYDDIYYDHRFIKRISAEHDDLSKECNLTYNGTCLCKGIDLLCENRGYDKAPNDIPNESIDILDFNGNNFQSLAPPSVINIPPSVNKISFVHCSINSVQEGTFYQLKYVQELYLDNNALKMFPSKVFAKQSHLKKLSLMYNSISKIHPKAFEHLQQLSVLNLRGNKLTEIPRQVLEPLENLTILYLQNNEIRFVDSTSFPRLPLNELSLMENKIKFLEKGAFSNLTSLTSLFLSNNRLTEVKNGTFQHLVELNALTLNDNFIKTIELGVFHDVFNLTTLELERNKFRMLDKRLLLPLYKLSNIYFDRFEMCAAATHVRNCYPKGDGISSQKHLLDNPLLRASVWIMGTIGCTGNIIVLLGRLLAPTNNVVHSLYLRNLALSDLLMGIYLFIIAFVDEHYRNVYLRHQYTWRHSFMCNLCGFLSTLSCESSVLILSLVTWDRFISVTQPLARKQPSHRTAALTLVLLWLLAAFVSLAPLSQFQFARNYFGDEFYGSNGVCLSLHIHDRYSKGWEYSAAMFILLNALALTFICYAYLRMINEIKASGVACRSTRQSQERDKVAKRFGIIVFTDCLCWVPVIIVKVSALSGIEIPQNVYAWLAIFVLPINSAINPILYTLTTTIFKKQVRKTVNSCVNKRKTDHQHSASESGFSLSFGVFPIGSGSRRILSYRGTQSSVTTSKNSWRRSTAV